jgi:hypothetical protein
MRPFGTRKRGRGDSEQGCRLSLSLSPEIARLLRLGYGVEVLNVDAGVTRLVEEVGAGAEPPLKRSSWSKRPACAWSERCRGG